MKFQVGYGGNAPRGFDIHLSPDGRLVVQLEIIGQHVDFPAWFADWQRALTTRTEDAAFDAVRGVGQLDRYRCCRAEAARVRGEMDSTLADCRQRIGNLEARRSRVHSEAAAGSARELVKIDAELDQVAAEMAKANEIVTKAGVMEAEARDALLAKIANAIPEQRRFMPDYNRAVDEKLANFVAVADEALEQVAMASLSRDAFMNGTLQPVSSAAVLSRLLAETEQPAPVAESPAEQREAVTVG